MRRQVDHIKALRKQMESTYEVLEAGVRSKSSKLTDFISQVGMNQVERGQALGDLEYQLKCLAHDLHMTEQTKMPQLHAQLHKQVSDMDGSIASAKLTALTQLQAAKHEMDEKIQSDVWASRTSMVTAVAIACPWILFCGISMSSLGYFST
ncbi:hypothetical protein H257_02983 [Aphanomyces astaci]|uniref:Uncharacterized protein n=2 Tax=Aphanomyces astaci TaxID=112090 RepID=W4GZR7_APHAT|nr:hypothetical protein H257_02983 [Aphanomyces astaci]ETV85137.1 hypothetical protein H257_02983 [Aphanomyces astaci]|eukprot:XP_009825155.1 hypothetical protein H257_02983 [Aphanomyces astaci]